MRENKQYFRYPVGKNNQFYMISAGTLWSYTNGILGRISNFKSEISQLCISPDGTKLSFFGTEESNGDVYLYEIDTGILRRLTYFDDMRLTNVALLATQAVVSSRHENHFLPKTIIYITLDDLSITYTKLTAEYIAFSEDGRTALQQNGYGYYSWSQYSGGQAAQIFECKRQNHPEMTGDETKSYSFENITPSKLQPRNVFRPIYLQNRLFCLGQLPKEPIGIYELLPDRADCISRADSKMQDEHQDYHVRDISAYEDSSLLYSMGGEIFCYSIQNNSIKHLEIPGTDYSWQDRPVKLADSGQFMTSLCISNNFRNVSIAARGHLLTHDLWHGTQVQHTTRIRYRQVLQWAEEQILGIKDDGDYSLFEVYNTNTSEILNSWRFKVGIVTNLTKIDDKGLVVINSKFEILALNLEDTTIKLIDRSWTPYAQLSGIAVEPKTKTIAYTVVAKFNPNHNKPASVIKLYHLESGRTRQITYGLGEYSPSFFKDSKQLVFLSDQETEPSYTDHHFGAELTHNTRVCVISLDPEADSPIKNRSELMYLEKNPIKEEKEADKTEAEPEVTPENKDQDEINKNKILEKMFTCPIRIISSKLPAGKYLHVEAISESKLALLMSNEDGGEDSEKSSSGSGYSLYCADLVSPNLSLIAENVRGFATSDNRDWWVLLVNNMLKAGKVGESIAPDEDKAGRGNYVSLPATRTEVNKRLEYENILYECWWLLKEHFWIDSMKDTDWAEVLRKYQKLLPKIKSREDLNSILEEMYGTLETSHAYTLSRGDIARLKHAPQGYLGAELKWNEADKGYEIIKICDEIDFDGYAIAPLLEPGVSLKAGDVITAISGKKVQKNSPIEGCCGDLGNQRVALTYKRGDTTKIVYPKLLPSLKRLQYREWTNKNRAYVHEKTGNRVGYVHIPDMGLAGFQVFHKAYLEERTKEAMIIDNRYNGGGNVSPLIISTLRNTAMGGYVVRNEVLDSFPDYANLGRMLLISNEHSGSDGDLFTYEFRRYNMGKILGKRTWGGVVGIMPRHAAVDHTVWSQPEFGIYQDDIGIQIENHGVEPDIDIDNPIMEGPDLQLEAGIREILKELPVEPYFKTLQDKLDAEFPKAIHPDSTE